MKTLRKRYVRVLATSLLLLLAVALAWASANVRISRDVSLPYHVWLIGEAKVQYDAGDYVTFAPPVDTPYAGHDVLLLKRIVCGPGQHWRADGKSVACDGVVLGATLTTDRQGRPVNPFIWDGPVPADSYVVMGTHPRSYDSRYFGFVRRRDIEATRTPVFR